MFLPCAVPFDPHRTFEVDVIVSLFTEGDTEAQRGGVVGLCLHARTLEEGCSQPLQSRVLFSLSLAATPRDTGQRNRPATFSGVCFAGFCGGCQKVPLKVPYGLIVRIDFSSCPSHTGPQAPKLTLKHQE